jgi:hypothetical protein
VELGLLVDQVTQLVVVRRESEVKVKPPPVDVLQGTVLIGKHLRVLTDVRLGGGRSGARRQ